MGRRLKGYIHVRGDDVLRKHIIPVMNADHITRLIKYDKYTYHHKHDRIGSNLLLLRSP